MFGTYTPTPATLLERGVGELLQQLSGVREGAEEAIHQTRVATRRVRESLVLLQSDFSDEVLAGIEDRLRRATRLLGRVRDADIGRQLIQHLEERFLFAPTALSRLRRVIADEQQRRRRKALKKLETLDLEGLPHLLAHSRRSAIARWPVGAGSWRGLLRQQMAERAEAVRAAMHHAGGVYFPNRVHAARVAIKQLRYTLELADLTALWRAPLALRVLKKTQDALGKAHDREVLIARVDELIPDESDPARGEAEALIHFMRAEALSFHAKYLRWRPRILDACAEAAAAAERTTARTRALVVAGVAVPSYVLLVSRLQSPVSSPR